MALIVPMPFTLKRKMFNFLAESPLVAKLQYGMKVQNYFYRKEKRILLTYDARLRSYSFLFSSSTVSTASTVSKSRWQRTNRTAILPQCECRPLLEAQSQTLLTHPAEQHPSEETAPKCRPANSTPSATCTSAASRSSSL